MKVKYINFIWGLLLIFAGAMFLAQNMGLIGELSPEFWKFIFAGLSLLFLATYFISGLHEWGWLFPASIFGGLAITISLAEAGVQDAVVAAPLFAGIAIPFLAAFLLDHKNWWALIPAWVMVALMLMMILVDRVPGEVIGSFVLLAVGLPFLLVYFTNRSRWWALIPGFIITAVAFIPILATQASGEFVGAFVLLAVAIPFFAIYLWSPKNWWALIPAGIVASVALVVLLSAGFGTTFEGTAIANGVIFTGIGLTFGVLWLRRKTQPTEWAKYPALGFLAAGLIAFAFGSSMESFWPLLLIIGGGLLLFGAFRDRRIAQ